MQAIHEVLQQVLEVTAQVVVSGIIISSVCRVAVEDVERFHRKRRKALRR